MRYPYLDGSINCCKPTIHPVGAIINRPVVLAQNHIAAGNFPSENPENVNIFGRAANSRPYECRMSNFNLSRVSDADRKISRMRSFGRFVI